MAEQATGEWGLAGAAALCASRRDRQPAYRCAGVLLSGGEIELRLEVHPELRVDAEPVPETESRVAGYRPLAAMIWLMRLGGTSMARANAVGLTPNSSSSPLRTSPGCTARLNMSTAFTLMVVHDFDFGWAGVATGPVEADAPLPVDADRILPIPIAPECFQAVAGQPAQGVQGWGCVQDREPPWLPAARTPWNAGTNPPSANCSVRLSAYPRIMREAPCVVTMYVNRTAGRRSWQGRS